jgi:hypothetical protein
MKRKSPRYLGMTGMQVGILATLSAVALLSICGVSWVILSTSASLSPPAAEAPTDLPIPATASPTDQASAEPTSTPTPTPLPIATSAPPGGWVEFQAQGVDLWLPGNFVGGDMLDQRSETIKQVDKLGKYFKNVVVEMRNAPKETLLWMLDKNIDQSIIITLVVVQHYTSTQDKNIDQFVQDDLNSNDNGTPVAMFITVNETKKMTLLGYEVRRLTFQQSIAGGHEAIGIIYYIKAGADFWTIKYSLDPSEYVDLLPTVEQSIHTFYLTK